MYSQPGCDPGRAVSRFDRRSFSGGERFTYIGDGSLGAKALGLARVAEIVRQKVAPPFHPEIEVDIPLLTVITTEAFDETIMRRPELFRASSGSLSDQEIASICQSVELPDQLVEDLRVFLTHIHAPLAIRSSSLLEDAMHEPFAGVYSTKLIPNNHSDIRDRLFDLLGAIKCVYASAFYENARQYLRATRHSCEEEKLAIIIQQAVGTSQNSRFYPHISGVARTYNFYPLGHSRPEDGVAHLALGFGKIIVEEGIAWSYSPACPQANPPYNAPGDLLRQSQRHFWSIDMSSRGMIQPANENEYLKKHPLSDAESDGTLRFIASTYSAADDRILVGVAGHGPRVLDFAYILKIGLIPLNALIRELLVACAEALGCAIELEFALAIPYPEASPTRFGLLQVRPMVVSQARVDVSPEELAAGNVVVSSESALGNGVIDSIRDVVYIRQEAFDAAHSNSIMRELDALNRRLVSDGCRYVLIGFGRWGSSDPSAGIPVKFGQIAGARVIVESPFPGVEFMPSQGTHFFHNLTSFEILYFSTGGHGDQRIDWAWLAGQRAAGEAEFVRHVRLQSPLLIKVDGRTGRGVILR